MNRAFEKHKPFMALVLRSPDQGDGWRKVSTTLRKMVENVSAEFPELYEVRDEDGLFIRLSERGSVVKDYI